ncbi:MAG: M56 family metallopeptidase [Candidatus Bathyarchaeia archaeon]
MSIAFIPNPLYLSNCVLGCITKPLTLAILVGTIILAFLTFSLIKFANTGRNTRLSLIYLHITSFIFLTSTFIVAMTCGMFLLNVFVAIVPIMLFIGMIATYLIGPRIYLWSLDACETRETRLNNWTRTYSKIMGVREPILYVTDEIEPAAFSAYGNRPKICISKPIMKILNAKEIKAIIIHELAHIRMKTQIFNISLSFLRFLTPFSLVHAFSGELDTDEIKADEYVKTIQGTSEHLNNAKGKISLIQSLNKH